MTAYEIIQHKQQGQANTAEEIRFMVDGALSGRVQESQIAAWFMAIYFRGMTPEETWVLTDAMWHSGEVFDLSAIDAHKADKHSTGGVGDKITFILAPMLAACGLVVPSITGRGLGHTGGTLDKMESLPGLRSGLDQDEFRKVLRDTGLSLIGQTENLVPADRLFYALRDVTATVASVPLICASILSKKLAEGIDSLVLDVKCGYGAIFQEFSQAEELARNLVAIADRGGKAVCALITDMNAPLGRQIGNWNELVESMECLAGYGSPDLMEVSYALGAAALMTAGEETSLEAALRRLHAVIHDGSALERYYMMIEAQGGSREWFLHPQRAPRPKAGRSLISESGGYVHDINSRELGLAAVSLGAGRQKKDDQVDHSAGISIHRHLGEYIRPGDPVCDIYASGDVDLEAIAPRILAAWDIRPERPVIEHSTCAHADGAPGWPSRILASIGLPFTPADWRTVLAEVGLGLRPHPHSPQVLS